jgi:hypothetical protein
MEFYRNKLVTLRKPKCCEGCFKRLEKGEKAHSIAGKGDDFYSYYFCLECEDFSTKHPGYCFDDNGYFTPGDVRTGRQEYERDQQRNLVLT